MMNSKENHPAAAKIDRLMDLLNNERLTRDIDDPLDRAIGSFQFRIGSPVSYQDFNTAIAQFVRHLYLRGIRLGRQLTPDGALGKAICILNKHYRGDHGLGYDGALLDATNGDLEGLERVLFRLGEIIKQIEREQYVNGVFFSTIDWRDWPMKKRVVEAYVEKFNEILPQNLRELEPERLVDYIQDLFVNHLVTDGLYGQLSGELSPSSLSNQNIMSILQSCAPLFQ